MRTRERGSSGLNGGKKFSFRLKLKANKRSSVFRYNFIVKHEITLLMFFLGVVAVHCQYVSSGECICVIDFLMPINKLNAERRTLHSIYVAWCIKFKRNLLDAREHLPEEKNVFFRALSWPQFGQLVQLLSQVIIQDWKVDWWLKILHILYNMLYTNNLKTVQSSNCWHVGGNRLLLLTKNALLKIVPTLRAGASPPPPARNARKKTFFWEIFP